MELKQRIGHQRVGHIVDSYSLVGHNDDDNEAIHFEAYLQDLLSRYPHGLVELALVETLVKSWLTIPMEKGVAFLTKAHNQLKAWQQDCQQRPITISLTPSQFTQITGLEAVIAFDALQQTEQIEIEELEVLDQPVDQPVSN